MGASTQVFDPLTGRFNTTAIAQGWNRSDPDSISEEGQWYVKKVGELHEAHFIDNRGNITQITSGGLLNLVEFSAAVVTIGADATLPNERALTGTANQIVISDNGAGSTVVLSLPQSIHTGATPTFVGITLSAGPLDITGALTTTDVITTKVTGDTQNRFVQNADGSMEWGSGSAAADVTKRRRSSGRYSQSAGTTPQSWDIYNTTDSDTTPVNYERMLIAWSANSAFIVMEVGGAGVQRSLNIGSSATNWVFHATDGSFHPGGNNLQDLGSGTKLIRNIYWGTQALGPNGTAAAPAIAGANFTSTGLLFAAGPYMGVTVNGTESYRFGTGSLQLGPQLLSFGSAIGVEDVILSRGGAGILEQRNGANAQKHYTYNTYTSSPNYESGAVAWVANTFYIGTGKGSGGGSSRELAFMTDDVGRWGLTTPGHLYPWASNTYDIGTASISVRNIYFGTQSIGTDGSAGVPTYTHSGQTTTGWVLRAASSECLSIAGTERFRFEPTFMYLLNDTAAIALGAGPDVFLRRTAAAVLSLQDADVAQEFRVWGATTGSKYLSMSHDGTDGLVDVAATSGQLTLGGGK